MKTPSVLRKMLKANDICIYQDSITSKTYIANYWESYVLNKNDNVIWYNTLPAKGSGWCSITIGDFIINDEHSQSETRKLVNKLEQIFDKTIKCHQDYDC